MNFLAFTIVVLSLCFAVQGVVVRTHDTSFTPDLSLRVTLKNITQGCSIRESVVVNGTSPGPALYIKPNKVTWIRVYNDMADQNLTMVRISSASTARQNY